MPKANRQPDVLISKEYPAAKRRLVAGNRALYRRTAELIDFDSLPNELELAATRQVANLPNRWREHEGLTDLRCTSKHIRQLILELDGLMESTRALIRHSSVESPYIAICHDVVGIKDIEGKEDVPGMSLPDAIRQNSPLPKVDEELYAADVDHALRYATPENLANLAYAFSARTGSASMKVLTGVARAATGDGRNQLWSANIDNLAILACAFTKNHLDLENDEVAMAIEAVAAQVTARGDDLLRHANFQQIATLVGAFMNHPEYDTAEIAIELLAWLLTERGDDLLPQASAEQLATVRAAFTDIELDCRKALAKLDEETAKRNKTTPPFYKSYDRKWVTD